MDKNAAVPINQTFRSNLLSILKPIFLFLILTCCGCLPEKALSLTEPASSPYFFDDCDKESLVKAINYQLDYLQSSSGPSGLAIGTNYYSNKDLQESLILFLEILQSSSSTWELNRRIRDNFTIYQADGRSGFSDREMLVTGYFEPVLKGSLRKHDEFRYPLYSVPDSLVLLRENGKTKIGRFDRNESFMPYWSRKDIEQLNLTHGHELVYLNDPLDAFLLHVQGSGKILLDNGEVRKIRYAGSNGLRYRSIGKLLVDEGKMTLAEASIPAIRNYLLQHPEERDRIFYHNKRFIFFQWGETDNVIGSLGKPLTPGRSIAIDQEQLPAGLLCYLVTRKPVIGRDGTITRWQQMRRFTLPQDSGSAIKGSGRADIFWGNDPYAEIAAGSMKEKGQLFFLVKADHQSNLHADNW